jgi:hypothetical protein
VAGVGPADRDVLGVVWRDRFGRLRPELGDIRSRRNWRTSLATTGAAAGAMSAVGFQRSVDRRTSSGP